MQMPNAITEFVAVLIAREAPVRIIKGALCSYGLGYKHRGQGTATLAYAIQKASMSQMLDVDGVNKKDCG